MLAAVFFLVFYRGEGFVWLTKAAFSRNVAQAMLWGAAGNAILFLRGGDRRRLAAAAFVSVAGCAVHLIFAPLLGMFLLGLAVHALRRGGGGGARRRVVDTAAVLLLAASVATAVRLIRTFSFGNEIHAHMQGMLLLGGGLVVLGPVELLSRMHAVFFFAVAGAIFLAPPFTSRKNVSLASALFWPPVIFVLFPPTATLLERNLGYLHYRILYAAPVMCMLAIVLARLAGIVLAGTRGKSGSGRIAGRVAALAALVFFAAVPLRFGLKDAVSAVREMPEASETPAAGEQIADLLRGHGRPGSVVISDPRTSYLISAYTDLFVATIDGQHGSPADTAAATRLRETRDLFSPFVPIAASVPWLRATGADLLLLDTGMPADFFGTMPATGAGPVLEKMRRCALFDEIDRRNGLVLFALRLDGGLSAADSASVLRADRGDACPEGSVRGGAAAVGETIRLEGICLERSTVAPGDTLRGTFLWSIGEPVFFGLPIAWTLRIDAPESRGTWHRPWYGKQYRRIVERRDGRFRRATFSGLVGAAGLRPDGWETGSPAYREAFAVVLPSSMAAGEWTMRVTVRRVPYMDNRTIADYLRSEDSFHGAVVGAIVVGLEGGIEGGEADAP